MRTAGNKQRGEQGNMILVCVMFSIVLGITIASYLVLVRSQYISTTRSHNWNVAMVLAEAGVEDALAFVNKNEGNFSNLKNWPLTAAADGWTTTGNVYHTQRTPDTTLGYYDVWITNLDGAVSIRVEGTATWDTSNPDNGVDGGNVRKLVVQAALAPLFSVAVGAGNNIDMVNNALEVDSFDSTDPAHSHWNPNSTFGVYDPTKAKADGNLAANGMIADLQSGNSYIYGSVSTGTGGLTNLQQNSSVGDVTWNQPGIQPGHGRDDMNVDWPAVQLPATNYFTLDTSPSNNPININSPGNYQVLDNFGLKKSLTVNATNVVLYLVHGLDYRGGGASSGGLRVTTNSTLTIYAGEQFMIDENSTIGSTNAGNLIIYGLTNLTSIQLWGTTNFAACIYAPQAQLTIGADAGWNSMSTYQSVGSYIVGSVTNLNPIQFHYDENLRRLNAYRAYVATNWTEL